MTEIMMTSIGIAYMQIKKEVKSIIELASFNLPKKLNTVFLQSKIKNVVFIFD